MFECWWKDAEEMKKLVLTFLILFIGNAHSLTLSMVEVYGEPISKCELSSESIDAALKSVMRYNRIQVSSSRVKLYHSAVAIDMSSSCAVNLSIMFYLHEKIYSPNLKTSLYADVVLCENNTLLTGPKYNLQTRVNDMAKEMVDKCLAKIDSK